LTCPKKKCDILEALTGCIDEILAIPGAMGAVIHDVYLLTRTWQGGEPGDGHAVDVVEEVLPTPQIVDVAHDVRLTEAGAIKQGDLIIKNISKNRYPTADIVDCSTEDKRVEKFYLIDEKVYQVIHVKEGYLTWDVHIRKLKDDSTYNVYEGR